MKAVYTKNQLVGVSMCDASGRLGISNTFALFQDIASEHAEILGVGNAAMQEKHAFWVTARTRVHFYRRPQMMQDVDITPWPAAPGLMRCDRYYRMEDAGEILAEGRTEWCVLDTQNGKVIPPATMFGPDIDYLDDAALTAPYARFRHNFTDEDCAVSHAVRPSDVDIGRHMNNVAYLRAIIDSFRVAELEQMNVTEMEIMFMMPCFEGEELQIMRRKTEFGYEFGVRRPDKRYGALALMKIEA